MSEYSATADRSAAGVMTGRCVICVSSIDWDFIWQGHQQIMSMLAADGNQVLFIDNTGVRRPGVRDLSRIWKRALNWWRGTKGFRRVSENLFVYSPLVLPFPYSRTARWVNRSIILRAIERWMRVVGTRRPLMWTFLPTALSLDLVWAVNPDLVVYYCIDDFAASSSGASRIRQTEDRLLADADLVFVTSERLQKRALQYRDTVGMFPFAVDYARFEAVRTSDVSVPDDLVDSSKPIVGYVGGLHRYVDQELAVKVARRLPDFTFVFVGPAQCDVTLLANEPNIRLLGARPHDQLPAYIKNFDVGIVPYVFSEYTANVYPTKLNEYLAMGIPVVSTGLAEIQRFNGMHGQIVGTADDPVSFAAALTEAVAETEPDRVERRLQVARKNSWKSHLQGMTTLIVDALEARRHQHDRWDVRLRRLYRAGRQQAFRTLVAVLAVYLLLFYTPLLWLVADPLIVIEEPQPADAIVVFAGGVGESGRAGGGYQERVQTAVELYEEGYAPTLVFSSGFIFAFQEADVMRDMAIGLGVPSDAIILERQASNTLENVVYVRNILRENDMSRVLLVSSPYHMRRALMTWRRQAPEIEALATPVVRSQYYAHTYGANLEQIRGIAWEYAALAAYWWKGRL